MQTSVKDTYIVAQSRMMYTAYIFFSLLGIGLMAGEAYLSSNPNPMGRQILGVMSIFTAVLFSLLAMLIVEVMYQDDIQQLPLIASLGRLTPELDLIERYTFLSVSIKRQITSTISLIAFWIAFGGTPRGASIVAGMVMITVLTAYGMTYLQSLPVDPNPDEQSGKITQEITSP